LLALLGANPILHISRIKDNVHVSMVLLTFLFSEKELGFQLLKHVGFCDPRSSGIST
jgi:hypothetical protein